MENILEELYYEYRTTGSDCVKQELIAKWEHILRSNTGNLNKTLNKQQKRLLLSIVDAKNCIAHSKSIDSFADGVRFGVKFMAQIMQS